MGAQRTIKLTCDTVAEDCPAEFETSEFHSTHHLRELARLWQGWTQHYPGAARILDFCPTHSENKS